MSAHPSVDICVATFKRPLLLSSLLRSLATQTECSSIIRAVIVVDNDPLGSAGDVVRTFAATVPFEVIYDTEPTPGISAARNRALAHSTGSHIAIVDDDETVAPDWLSRLLNACERFDADVVFGPVVQEFPDGSPRWATRHSAFRRVTQQSGRQLTHGASGNVLLRRSAIEFPSQRFDSSYGQTGGGDTEFFHRLHLSGKRLVWCDEAVAFETVPLTRVSLRWILQRSFRSGQVFYRVFVTRYPPHRKAFWFARKSLHVCAALAAVPFARALSYSLFAEVSAAGARAVGQLSARFTTAFYREYHGPHSS